MPNLPHWSGAGRRHWTWCLLLGVKMAWAGVDGGVDDPGEVADEVVFGVVGQPRKRHLLTVTSVNECQDKLL